MKLNGKKLPFLVVFSLFLMAPIFVDAQEKTGGKEVKKEKQLDKDMEKPTPKNQMATKKDSCPDSSMAWKKIEIEEHNAINYKNCVRQMSKQYSTAKKMTSAQKNQMKQAMTTGYKMLIEFYHGYGNDEEEADELQSELDAMGSDGSSKKKTKNKGKS